MLGLIIVVSLVIGPLLYLDQTSPFIFVSAIGLTSGCYVSNKLSACI